MWRMEKHLHHSIPVENASSASWLYFHDTERKEIEKHKCNGLAHCILLGSNPLLCHNTLQKHTRTTLVHGGFVISSSRIFRFHGGFVFVSSNNTNNNNNNNHNHNNHNNNNHHHHHNNHNNHNSNHNHNHNHNHSQQQQQQQPQQQEKDQEK